MDLDIIYDYAKHIMEHDPSGHDLNHLSRVSNLAMAIADSENFTQWEKDMTLVAVYLHDTIDDKVISNREQAIETATQVGKRHGKPVIIKIDCNKAISNGVKFYLSENDVYLSDNLSADTFIIE